MPNYTGVIALVLGIIVSGLGIVGVKLPDDFTGQMTQLITGIITVVTMAIGVWRLLHTKKVAEVKAAQGVISNAQLMEAGKVPIAGPLPTEADRLNAEQLLLRKAKS